MVWLFYVFYRFLQNEYFFSVKCPTFHCRNGEIVLYEVMLI